MATATATRTTRAARPSTQQQEDGKIGWTGAVGKRKSSNVVDLCDSDSSDSDIDAVEIETIVVAAATMATINSSGENNDDSNKAIGVASRKRRRSSGDEVAIVNTRKPPPPLAQVIEVFPDVAHHHVESMLSKGLTVPLILSHLAEKSYPKAAKKQPGKALVKRSVASSIDFMSPTSFTPSRRYSVEAKSLLLNEFAFLSESAAQSLLRGSQNHYAICHDKVMQSLQKTPSAKKAADEDEDLARYLSVEVALSEKLTKTQKEALKTHAKGKNPLRLLSRFRKCPKQADITDPTLREEHMYVQEKTRAWKEEHEARLQCKKARTCSQQDGTAMECACCYEMVSLDEMAACREEGHLFCLGCLRSYVESQIFGSGSLGVDPRTKKPASDLLCFHGDGCTSGFDRVHLQRALPGKVLAKFDEIHSQAALAAAELKDLCACPKCGYQAVLPSSMSVFSCPVSDCQFESCRKCQGPSHIPLRCDEVEKDKRETSGRLQVEEAISAAKIRSCPKCKKSFVKTDGCNKISCGCGAAVCYICRKVITDGYKHFCQVPHCRHKDGKCGKCPLWTKAEEDDEQAMREAGIQAAERVRFESLKKGKNDEEVRVDVESILRDPKS